MANTGLREVINSQAAQLKLRAPSSRRRLSRSPSCNDGWARTPRHRAARPRRTRPTASPRRGRHGRARGASPVSSPVLRGPRCRWSTTRTRSWSSTLGRVPVAAPTWPTPGARDRTPPGHRPPPAATAVGDRVPDLHPGQPGLRRHDLRVGPGGGTGAGAVRPRGAGPCGRADLRALRAHRPRRRADALAARGGDLDRFHGRCPGPGPRDCWRPRSCPGSANYSPESG